MDEKIFTIQRKNYIELGKQFFSWFVETRTKADE